MGDMKAVKKSLKKGGQPGVKNIPGENSLTVRFLDEPYEWAGYYEHWVGGNPLVCSSDCEGCDSDDPEESRKSFKYLANCYVHDDQRVWAVKMPKTLGEQVIAYHEKNKTLLDRDYDLSKTGSGKQGTRYMAAPDSPKSMKLSRFEDKKYDLDVLLECLLNDEEYPKDPNKSSGDGTSGTKKSKTKKEKNPWDEDDDDKPRKVKKSSGKKKKSGTVVKKSTSIKRPVKKSSSVKRKIKK